MPAPKYEWQGYGGKSGSRVITPQKSAGIAAHVLALIEDVALHRTLDVFFGGAGLEIELGVESIELEEITMGFARRRARTTVADFAEVVAALAGAVGGLLGLGEVLRKAT